jgi:hypothetical protein
MSKKFTVILQILAIGLMFSVASQIAHSSEIKDLSAASLRKDAVFCLSTQFFSLSQTKETP